MIARVTGRLDALDGSISPGTAQLDLGNGIVLSAMLPAFVRERLEDRLGSTVTLHTRFDLEAPAQGSVMTPRLVGFNDPSERAFFELFTSVKGLGVRKALKAMAVPPAEIAGAIAARDAKALIKLPEIGKRLAETVVAELHGKVDRWLLEGAEVVVLDAASRNAKPADPLEDEAVAALVALGQSVADAERMVARARAALGERAGTASTEDLIAAAFGRTA
ncbi:MAG: Holliday junction branch migration protein RuvA [Planctomycetota bacterium]